VTLVYREILDLWEIRVYQEKRDLQDHRVTLVYREILDLWEIRVYQEKRDLPDLLEPLD
jgi:hypothetical protein